MFRGVYHYLLEQSGVRWRLNHATYSKLKIPHLDLVSIEPRFSPIESPAHRPDQAPFPRLVK